MARSFAPPGSRLDTGDTPVIWTGWAFAWSVWIRPSVADVNPTGGGASTYPQIVGTNAAGDSTWSSYFLIANDADSNRGQLQFGINMDSDIFRRVLSPKLQAGVWHHAYVDFPGDVWGDQIRIFVNGVQASYVAGGNGTGHRVPESGRMTFGMNVGIPGLEYRGDTAHFAHFTGPLRDTDIRSLAAGARPQFVRPDALVAYWPLSATGSGGVEKDVIRGIPLRATGTGWAPDPGIAADVRRRPPYAYATSSIPPVDPPSGGVPAFPAMGRGGILTPRAPRLESRRIGVYR